LARKGGQDRKQRAQSIRSLEEHIAATRDKLEAEPNAPAAGHWRRMIREWTRQIERHRERMRHD
jgi:hypothetical protein